MSDTSHHVPFDEPLRDRLRANLDRHQVRTHPLEGRRHAAVAIVVLDSDAELHGSDDTDIDRMRDLSGIPGVDINDLTGKVDGTAGGASILLTRRGSRLNAHARQWAFPGGRLDDGEDELTAALREMEEEVGLSLGPDDLLGQ